MLILPSGWVTGWQSEFHRVSSIMSAIHHISVVTLVVGVSTLPAVADDAQLGQSEDKVMGIQYSVCRPDPTPYPSHLPFSSENRGPPESPWHESLPLFPAHT